MINGDSGVWTQKILGSDSSAILLNVVPWQTVPMQARGEAG
jgi:hypothetical protein